MSNEFPEVRFKAQLRPSQSEVVEIARRKLAAGQRRLHIVAPPGSGKTVLGLFLWAQCVRQPALVLSPNSAIQAQWAAKTNLFEFAGFPDQMANKQLVSTTPGEPRLLTSLTYQSLTIPSTGNEEIESQALRIWREKLIEKGQAIDPQEADVWIDDLKRHNPSYFERRLSAYRKQVRDERTLARDSLDMLHGSALATLERLRDRGLGLIIFDECHHLLGHWGRVLADAHEFLAQPIVIGLTATPPDRDGKLPADVARYDEFFGDVDYEVPVPAVVKDGFLAPYQDLAYIVRPTNDELTFVANADQEFQRLVEGLCAPRISTGAMAIAKRLAAVPKFTSGLVGPTPGEVVGVPVDGESHGPTDENLERCESLPEWLERVLGERRLPTGIVKEWSSFERRDPEFATAARLFLLRRGWELPAEVPMPPGDWNRTEPLDLDVLVPVLDRYVRHRLRRSPVAEDRDLAETVVRRLRVLGAQITETSCQPCASPVGRVLGYSQSKAAAAPAILRAEYAVLGDCLRAVVVTDYEKTSAVTAEVKHLLDAEAGGAIAAFKTLLADPVTDQLNPVLITGSSVLVDDDVAHRFDSAAQDWLRARGRDVELVFSQEAGFHAINGIGNDWCPRLYVEMITELFQTGITKCLVGTRGLLGEGWDANKINVLIDLTTVTTSMTVNQLRGRSLRLDPERPEKLADNWDVVCIAPEFTKGLDDYRRFMAKHKSLFGITDDGEIEKGVGHVHPAFTEMRPEGLEGSAQLLNADMLARVERRSLVRQLWKIGQPYQGIPTRVLEARLPADREAGFPPFHGSREAWNSKSLTHALGEAVLASLAGAGLVRRICPLHVAERTGGYVRVLLEQANDEEIALFTEALQEALGPLVRPRYVIPRSVDRVQHTWLSRVLPSIVGRYFEHRRREQVMLHAVPSVLARNKDLVAVYQQHWNRLVSPGEAIYVLRGEGERLFAEATDRRQVPRCNVRQKEIFR